MTIVVDVVCAILFVRFALYAVSEAAAPRGGDVGQSGRHYRRAGASAVVAAALVGCAIAYDLNRSTAVEICAYVVIVASVVFMLSARQRVRAE